MNAIDWTTIGAVPTTNKCVSLVEYQVYDNESCIDITYYRLKMVDKMAVLHTAEYLVLKDQIYKINRNNFEWLQQ